MVLKEMMDQIARVAGSVLVMLFILLLGYLGFKLVEWLRCPCKGGPPPVSE